MVWAVGDIHGRLDLLAPLTDAIVLDSAGGSHQQTVVIFLGDYIDRGPDSRGVLHHLTRLPQVHGIEWRFLKGNHEEAMMRFLKDPGFGSSWCDYGGDAALGSFGLKPPTMRHRLDEWVRLAADLNHKLTVEERSFLEDLQLCTEVGDYFFAHAGARPGRSLSKQSPEDLLWIRKSFLDSTHAFSKIVVHGHTPEKAVFSDHRRVGVDTKAYESGVLSALRLQDDGRQVLQSAVVGEAGIVEVSGFKI